MLIKILSTAIFFLFSLSGFVRDDLTVIEKEKVKKVTSLTTNFSKAERSEALSGGAGTVNKIGKLLKNYRKKANLTQPQLAGASGVATSIVNDVENGIRNAGSKTLDRIARGLNLSDEERFTFIMYGLSLSKRDFLIPDFSDYPPEVLNYLPFVFQKSGIQPKTVKKIILPSKEDKRFQVVLKNGKAMAMEIRLSPVK